MPGVKRFWRGIVTRKPLSNSRFTVPDQAKPQVRGLSLWPRLNISAVS